MEQGDQLPHFREEGVAGGCQLQLALPLEKLQWHHTLHLLSLLLLLAVLEQRSISSLVCNGHLIAHLIAHCTECHSVLDSKSHYLGFEMM